MTSAGLSLPPRRLATPHCTSASASASAQWPDACKPRPSFTDRSHVLHSNSNPSTHIYPRLCTIPSSCSPACLGPLPLSIPSCTIDVTLACNAVVVALKHATSPAKLACIDTLRIAIVLNCSLAPLRAGRQGGRRSSERALLCHRWVHRVLFVSEVLLTRFSVTSTVPAHDLSVTPCSPTCRWHA